MDKANGGRAWAMTAVSIMLGVCFAVSMYKAVATLPFIMEDYDVTIAQAGNLMAILGYLSMIMSLPGGFIIKKVGAKRAAVVCTLLAIAGNVIAIWSQSFAVLLVSRVFEGVGYGLISIIMQTVINAWFTTDKRGLPLSLSNLYLSVGMILALNAASFITPAFGWKGNWWLNLGMYAVMLVAFVAVVRMPETGDVPVQAAGGQTSGKGSLAALKHPVPWLLALCFFCYAFAFAAFNSYYPTFLSQSLGMDSGVANGMTSIYTVAMIVSTFLIGVVLNKVEPRRHALLLLVCMVLYAASSIPMFVLSEGAVVPYLVVFGLLSGTVPGVIFCVAPRAFEDPSMVPVTLGVIMLGMGVAASVGTQVVGVIVELLGWSGLTALFAVLAVLGSIAAAAVKRVLK